MTTLQAFLLGMMVVMTPSIVVTAFLLVTLPGGDEP